MFAIVTGDKIFSSAFVVFGALNLPALCECLTNVSVSCAWEMLINCNVAVVELYFRFRISIQI